MYMRMETQEMQALEWFKKKYGLKDFKFTLRKFKPRAIIQDDKNHKVVDIYPEKIDGFHFVVYNKKSVAKRSYSDSMYGDPSVEHSIRITHSYEN